MPIKACLKCAKEREIPANEARCGDCRALDLRDEIQRVQGRLLFNQACQEELTTQKDLNQKLQADNRDLLKDIQNYKQKITTHAETITQLNQTLTQQKEQHQNHLTQTKAQIRQEITLLKGVLA